MAKIKCKECGQEFVGRKGRKFCSRKCYISDWKKRIPGHNKGEWFESKCLYCGIVFVNGKRGYTKKFCSRKCANCYNVKIGEEHHNWTGKYVCRICGEKTSRPNVLCRKCHDKFAIGENANGYIDGRTSLYLVVRHSKEYREWRRRVFKRDDYTCRNCFKRGGKIEANHIVPFAFLFWKYDIKTLEEAKKCKELWRVSNGKTLCKDCHRQIIRQSLWAVRNPMSYQQVLDTWYMYL